MRSLFLLLPLVFGATACGGPNKLHPPGTVSATVGGGAPASGGANTRPPVVSAPSHLTQEQAVADVTQAVDLLISSHPDPYRAFGGKVAFERSAAALVDAIPHAGLDVAAVRLLLADFFAELGDGHTYVERGGASAPAASDRLPILFDVTAEGIHVVASNVAEMKGTRGSQVVGANGVGINELVKRWSSHAPVENRFHALAQVARGLSSPQWIARLAPPATPTALSLDLVTPDGTKETRLLPTAVSPQPDVTRWVEAPHRGVEVANREEPYSFQFLRNNTVAYLRVATLMGREAYEFALAEGWGTPAMLDAYYQKSGRARPATVQAALAGIPSLLASTTPLLEEMKRHQTPTLVIDLQGNDGGVTSMAFPFLHQLYGDAYYNHDFPLEFATVYSALYLDKVHKDLSAARAETGRRDLRPGDYVFERKPEGTAAERRAKALEGYATKQMSFAGQLATLGGQPIYTPPNVVVLCDEGTFSAAFHFLFFLRELGAVVIGVPPGQAPNTFMETTPFVLRNSAIKGSISNSAQIWVTSPEASVLEPDEILTHEEARKYGYAPDSIVQLALDRIATGTLPRRHPAAVH